MITIIVNHWENIVYFHESLLLLIEASPSLQDFQDVFIILQGCSLIKEVASELYYNKLHPSNCHTSSITAREVSR